MNVVNILDNNRNIIGKYIESRKSNIDSDKELYRIYFYFYYGDSSKTNMKFDSLEFVAYKPNDNGTGLIGTGYHNIIEGYKFEVYNLTFENLHLKGNFEGYLFYSPILSDTLTNDPVYLEGGTFNINIK